MTISIFPQIIRRRIDNLHRLVLACILLATSWVVHAQQCPSDVSLSAGDGMVTVSWNDPPGMIAERRVQYRETGGMWYQINPATSPVTVGGLTNGQSYYFRVGVRIDGGENFCDSGTKSATPASTPTNQWPAVIRLFPTVNVNLGGVREVDASGHFRDPDRDVLSYRSRSLDEAVVTVSVSGSVLTLSGRSGGSARIVVTADDGNGGSATTLFTAKVNYAPVVVSPIPDIVLEPDERRDLDVASHFSDADGDELTYSARSDNPAITAVSVSGSVLTLIGRAEGNVDIAVTADDGKGGMVTDTFMVTVEAPDLMPDFGAAMIMGRSLELRLPIEPLVLPEAMGGDGALRYALSPALPTGLVLDENTRTISGTPQVMMAETGYAWTVTDEDGDQAALAFTLEVKPLPAPMVVGELSDVTLEAGGKQLLVQLDEVFAGRELLYRAQSADLEVVMASADERSGELTLTSGYQGQTQVTAAVMNEGGEATLTFTVTVVTSAEERAVLKGSLSGQARSMLNSAIEVIGARVEDSTEKTELSAASMQSLGSLASGLLGISGLSLATSADANCNWGLSVFDPCDAHIADGHANELRPDWSLWGRQFTLPLSAAGSDGDTALGWNRGWIFWGAADRQDYENELTGNGSYDSDWNSVYVGADRGLDDNWLLGLALSHGWGDTSYDYGDAGNQGKVETDMTTVYPYVRGSFRNNLFFWGMAGFGWGETETGLGSGAPNDLSDSSLTMGAVGARKPVWQMGALSLSALGDLGVLKLETDAGQAGLLEDWDVTVSRMRFGLEGSYELSPGLTGYARVSGRFDGGDGADGSGTELQAGVRYGMGRWLGELHGRWLAAYSEGDYEETGVSGRLGYRTLPDGTGLSLLLTPRWGVTTSNDGLGLWRDEQMRALRRGHASAPAAPTLGLESRLSYGLRWPGQAGSLLRPFLDYRASGADSRQARLGVQWSGLVDLELSLQRLEQANMEADHGMMLQFGRRLSLR